MSFLDFDEEMLSRIRDDDEECDWFCDGCDEYMNDQPGFTTATGTWVCTICGEVNDVSPDNEFDPWNHD